MDAGDAPREAIESYCAADVSADLGEPVDLPLSNRTLAHLADMNEAKKVR